MQADVHVMIGSLGELAAMPGMPSEPTLRKMIEANADFPVISRGKNGVAYEFDLAEAARFVIALRQREEDEARARAEAIRQMGLDLLGDDALSAKDVGLSSSDRRALIEEEIAAIKLAERRGVLVRRDEVAIAISEFVALVAERSESLPARLARRVGLSREALVVLEEILRADRERIADAMAGLVAPVENLPDNDVCADPDPAV